MPIPRTTSVWSERHRTPDTWLGLVESAVGRRCPATRRGGEFDRWDLQLRGGILGVARMRMGVEEHGGGRQFMRFRSWPVPSAAAMLSVAGFAGLCAAAAIDGAAAAAIILGSLAVTAGLWALHDCAAATGTLYRALGHEGDRAADESAEHAGRDSSQPRPEQGRLPALAPVPASLFAAAPAALESPPAVAGSRALSAVEPGGGR